MSGPPPTLDILSRPAVRRPVAPAVAPQREGSQRLRWSLYLSFALLLMLVLVQAAASRHFERERAADFAIGQLAGQETMLALEFGRHAAMLAAPADGEPHAAQALADTLARSRANALQLDRQQAARQAAATDRAPQLQQHWRAAQVARDRMWQRADQLLVWLRNGGKEPFDIEAAAAALQAEVAPTLAASLALTAQLQADAEARHADRSRLVVLGVTLSLLTLVLLSLVVVEPTARAVDRQVNQLATQGAELERLALVAERTHTMVLLTDRDDRVLWANEAFTRMSGFTLQDALGRRPGVFLHNQGAAEEAVARMRNAVDRHTGERLEILCATRDGRDLWLDVDLQPLHDADGAFSGFVSVSTDITQQVADRTRLATLLATLPAGVLVHSARGEIVDANRSAEAMLGCSLAQLLGGAATRRRWRVQCEDGSECPASDLPPTRTLRSGIGVRGETLGVRLPDGTQRWLLVNTEPLPDAAGGHGVLTCFVDVTEPRRLQEQLRALARTDTLTGLPNRAVVLDRVQRAIGHAKRHPGYGFGVLFMDFDRFKQVNDSLGHSVGDALLRQIAARLDTTLRPGDAVARVASQLPMAARIGGDEFVVVLEGTRGIDDVGAVTQRLLAELSQPYVIGQHTVQSGVSIGVVTSAHAAETADAVLRDADTAMYEAKRGGRGRCVFFDSSMHERVVQRLSIENDLRRALRDGELYVVYQPVVDLASGAPAGVEALVRWRHPQRGTVPPVEFIGVAEEAGLIDAIGAVVLRQACRQFAQWRAELGVCAPRQLAVNLSRAQLKLPGLVGEVRAVLEDTGVPPSALQLEVTESLAAQDEAVQATLRALKALGVKLALDDFGTGYSSLACLHLLPVDTVKIDRSFVGHAETVEYHRVLIEATIRVARTLGMSTVAEGVETAGQAALMHSLQCDRGQGWLYGRAMAADELAAWAVSQTARPA
jgi:diguanylate cyclase (GGDEF)-like protein/PAS domain S-box-containing protein